MNTEDPRTTGIEGVACDRCRGTGRRTNPYCGCTGDCSKCNGTGRLVPARKTIEPTVEDCRRELRAMFPEVQICVGIRDCGEETQTLRGTTLEYDAQIGMNGEEFAADSLSELMAQVRSWKQEQEK